VTRRSLAVPFQRAASDFAAVDDDALLRAQVEQVLGTECSPDGTGGELPWRTAFGTPLHLLRHRAMTEAQRALAQVWMRDALSRWVPQARVTAIELTVASETLTIRVRIARSTGTMTVTVTRPLAG